MNTTQLGISYLKLFKRYWALKMALVLIGIGRGIVKIGKLNLRLASWFNEQGKP